MSDDSYADKAEALNSEIESKQEKIASLKREAQERAQNRRDALAVERLEHERDRLDAEIATLERTAKAEAEQDAKDGVTPVRSAPTPPPAESAPVSEAPEVPADTDPLADTGGNTKKKGDK